MATHEEQRAALNKAQKLVGGKGIMGWITRLFMGKKFSHEMSAAVKQAHGYLDAAENQSRLLTEGAPAQATVLGIQDTGTMVNHNPAVILTLQVQPAAGAAFQITTQIVVSKIAIPRVNDTLSIKYDPQDQTQIVIIS